LAWILGSCVLLKSFHVLCKVFARTS
jgi:hypothetical protein